MPLDQQVRLVAHGIDREQIGLGDLLQVLDGLPVDLFDEIHDFVSLPILTNLNCGAAHLHIGDRIVKPKLRPTHHDGRVREGHLARVGFGS